MRRNTLLISIALGMAALASAPGPLAGATFGNVVTTVGGHPSDIALDGSRGQLYIANFTALEIDVMSTKDNAIHSSIPLPSHPSGLALSPDSAYLVVTEYQNGTSVPQGFDGVTVINLASNAKQNFSTGDPALGVAFVNTGQALIATSTGFYLLDPVSGYLQAVTSVAAAAGQPLPVQQATFPPQIIQTQMTASADGRWIWGVAIGGTGTQGSTSAQLVFRYNVGGSFVGQVWVTSPPLLPRVSVAADGSWAMIGWSKFAPAQCGGSGFMIPSRYPQSVASTNVTGHAVNAKNGATDTIYAQIFDTTQPSAPPYYPATGSAKFPTLSIMDADNLTVRDKVYLPEDLVGRAVLDSAGNNMYAISDSGVTVLPVGSLNHYPRLATSVEDVLVQTNFCNVNPLTATFTIADPGNNSTDFSISSPIAGVLVSPASGKTPATITVTVQPGAVPNPGGTLAVPLIINSGSAVNVAPAVRLLISNPDLDQRGTIVDIPGQLVDLLPDPAGRNRFYVMRQDKNQVLVFDGSNYGQIAALRTGTTPTGMSFTSDGKSLIVASTDSQLLQVFDLDSFQPQTPIQLPASHYGRSVAQSNVGTFAVVENDSALATSSAPPPVCNTVSGVEICVSAPPAASVAPPAIDRLDLYSRCAYSPLALGVYTNSDANLPPTTVLSPSPDQNSILVAAPNGNVMLYDATKDTFTLSRKDLSALSGAYAASSGASSSSSGPAFATRYVIGDNIFDASLVPQGTLDTSIGHTSGFAFMGAGGYRVTGTTASAAGVIENLPNVLQATNVKPVRTIEAPILTSTSQPFTRTVAPLGNSIVVLTTSGVTVLAPNYDAAVASPSISSVVSAADGSASVAPGGLISVYGQQMSPVNMATSQIPLPTALAGSCLAVNGVPAPLLFVSSQQVNAQLPASASGTVTLSIHTPGGVSDNYFLPILATAPTVFRSGTAGPETGLATVFRNDNGQLITPTNPVHPGDIIIIYATGMGRTSPFVDSGLPALLPPNPLSNTVIKASVTLGGVPLNILYAGLVPGEVGVDQINASVPGGVPLGMSIPLVVSQGGSSTTLSVRVVQ
jgi:uncharacterized protein (TIGR03437 family)